MHRPKKFSEVIGQEIPIQLIKNGLKNKLLPRAIIFYGSSGVGKTTLARLIAATSFCLSKEENGDVCGECAMCKGVQNGSIPDLLEFDAASHTSVEDIREILDLCNYVPQSGKEKIFIIDEAHMLSRNAIAALLKTLEETKEGIRFILATTEIDKISSAIKSRCFCVPLQDLDKENVCECLKSSAEADEITIDEESIELISKVSYGSMREALSVFYRAAMLDKKITKNSLMKILSYTDEQIIEKIANLILAGDYKNLYEVLMKSFYEDKTVAISIIRQLLDFFKKNYENSNQKEKIVKVLISLNKLHLETMKTSMYNEVALITLCEIAQAFN
ncbi:DNA polymerase III subunit gamma/tau [Alphaproteobacteria bacterium endosymbiont of Tiliacea citrago]|uniref:DNA polymerase III subunit gamma/tau n=1 Tax=Alphaproteobacteria bacterium endosymbiont of Tiliacea citrago TaxID=3077944 RepID=UPI00313D6D7F